MATRFELTEDAVRDLEQAAAYLAEESEIAALNLADDVEHALLFIATWPGCGHRRPDITRHPDIRFWTNGDYLICYRLATDPLLILGVVYGARDSRPNCHTPRRSIATQRIALPEKPL